MRTTLPSQISVMRPGLEIGKGETIIELFLQVDNTNQFLSQLLKYIQTEIDPQMKQTKDDDSLYIGCENFYAYILTEDRHFLRFVTALSEVTGMLCPAYSVILYERVSFDRFEKGNETGLEGQIMMRACGDIATGWGEESLVFSLPDNGVLTGQMWYSAFKNNALTLKEQYSEIELAERYPASYLLLSMLGEV